MLIYYKWREKVKVSNSLKSLRCREIPALRSRDAIKAKDSPRLNQRS